MLEPCALLGVTVCWMIIVHVSVDSHGWDKITRMPVKVISLINDDRQLVDDPFTS